MITQDTVEHVAKLARLSLSPQEAATFSQELNNILSLVEQLNELDLSAVNIDARHAYEPVLRPDAAANPSRRDELLSNAPVVEEGFFRVPRILES